MTGSHIHRRAVNNSVLYEAWIEGDGLYSGEGENISEAQWRTNDYFKKPLEQIHTKQVAENIDDSTGVLGNLKDDGSVKCPTFVNSKLLSIKVISDWHKTSTKCDREDLPWSASAKFIKRDLPFAQNKACYHRLSFCHEGSVHVIDRQYKTFFSWVKENNPAVKSVLGDEKDTTIKCPHFINPKLRKRVVQNWYPNGKRCESGVDGYDSEGFKRIAPYAIKGKCYQRLVKCHEGLEFFKDSEYKSYEEWSKTQVIE